MTIDVLILIWQITGTLRSFARSQADRPDLINAVITLGAVTLCLPLTALPHLDRVAANYQANLPDEVAPETGLVLVPTYAVLHGPVSFPMFTALEKALTENSELARLVLHSDGGRVFAARAIARLVRDYGLATHVEDTCASACTLIFIAGYNRSMGPDARLGFHGYQQTVYVETVSLDEEEAKDRAAFLAQGVSEDFVDQIFVTGPDDMWFPAQEVLTGAGVLNAP
ncbi:MAG: hypothetical protein GY945_11350 [Rhodobacteraceae bacterium]|nr:hypothetical protein [Paracoccaceae bacterium]